MHGSQDDLNARQSGRPQCTAVRTTSMHGSLDDLQCTVVWTTCNAQQSGRRQCTAVRTTSVHGSLDDLQCTAVWTTSMHSSQDDLNARQSGGPAIHGSLDDLQHTGAFMWRTRVSIFVIESRCLLSVLVGLLLQSHLRKARLLSILMRVYFSAFA